MKIIPSRIAEARKLSGMSQRDLALALGVTVQAVSQWENGKTDAGSRLASLALALQCDPDFLLNQDYMRDLQLDLRKGSYTKDNRVALIALENASSWIFDQRTSERVSKIVIRDLFASHEISVNSFALEVSLASQHFATGDILIFDHRPPSKGDYVCGISLKPSITKLEARPDGSVSLPSSRGLIMKLTGSDPDDLSGEQIRIRQGDDTLSLNNSVIIIGTLIEHRTFPFRLKP